MVSPGSSWPSPPKVARIEMEWRAAMPGGDRKDPSPAGRRPPLDLAGNGFRNLG